MSTYPQERERENGNIIIIGNCSSWANSSILDVHVQISSLQLRVSCYKGNIHIIYSMELQGGREQIYTFREVSKERNSIGNHLSLEKTLAPARTESRVKLRVHCCKGRHRVLLEEGEGVSGVPWS